MTADEHAPGASRATLCALVAATIGWRFVLSLRTPVPSGDGTSYLWIAQQFAAGRWSLGLSEVFPPGFPLLCAPWLWLGCDAWTTGLWICLLSAGFTVVPIVRIADHVRPGAGVPAGILWATSSLLARNAAEVYSEPAFLLVMAMGCLCGCKAQWWRCGVWAGIAYWIRPEGALLAASFVASFCVCKGVGRLRALPSLVPLAVSVAALAGLRWWHGHGFDPLPMLAFHEHERLDLPERGLWLANLLQVPAAWFEAFGPAGLLPLVLAVPALRRGNRDVAPLAWQIVLQIAVVCTFVTRRRFLLSAGVPALALAGVAAAALPRKLRRALLAVLCSFGLVSAWYGVTDADRIAERLVGEHLAAQLQPGEEVAGDLTRVMWFAGRRPLWPKHYTVQELLTMAGPPQVRFVVLSERSQRDQFAELAKGLEPSFRRLELPPDLERLARERGLAVFVRR